MLVSLVLPWTGGVPGWQILAGVENFGLLPRLFTVTAVLFGVLGSAVALAGRHWAAAWTAPWAAGSRSCHGVWAIWSRQVNVPHGGTGPGIGLVLAVIAMVVLTVSWVKIAAPPRVAATRDDRRCVDERGHERRSRRLLGDQRANAAAARAARISATT